MCIDMNSAIDIKKQIENLENTLTRLRNELDKKDDSPIESSQIRKEIEDSIKYLNVLKDKFVLDPKSEKSKKFFDDLRKSITEDSKYKKFFDL